MVQTKAKKKLRVFTVDGSDKALLPVPGLKRTRPRRYAEWVELFRWEKIPTWEWTPPGYLLKFVREEQGLTQGELASRLGTSQQAVAQAERETSNPTIGFIERWLEAAGSERTIQIIAGTGTTLL